MGTINRNNYEAYFIDYLDGNLDSGQKDELMTFLRDNPDLKQVLDEFENVSLGKHNEVTFHNKENLKKQLTISAPDYSIFDELSISRLEGELTKNQTQEFDQLLKEFPDKKKEYKLYEKTILKPDKKLRYPDKSYLKYGKTIQIYRKTIYRYVAFAASVLLLISLYIFSPETQDIPYNDKLNEMTTIADNKLNNDLLSLPDIMNDENEEMNINISSISNKKLLSQLKLEENLSVSDIRNKEEREMIPEPIQTKYSIRISEKPVVADIVEPNEINKDFQFEDKDFNNYEKVNRFLAKTLENPIKKNQGERNFSLWEIADLGFEGISKLTGKKILLERHYNEQGDLERLAFQTESFSFSTNLKK